MHLVLVLRALGDTCLAEAQAWAQAGLERAPKDSEPLLAAGTIAEAIAVWTPGAVASRGNLSPRELELAQRVSFDRRRRFDDASRFFERAVATDPDLAEARLHLGRVYQRLERADAARAAFATVLGESRERAIAYLAHLFLGKGHEDGGRLGDAEAEYRAALLEREAQSGGGGALASAAASGRSRSLAGRPREGPRLGRTAARARSPLDLPPGPSRRGARGRQHELAAGRAGARGRGTLSDARAHEVGRS